MEFSAQDLLWLLLPLAAASGWWIARLEHKHRRAKGARDFPSAYFKGLNFLLNEQPDKAIEVFVKVLEVDSETVETHLALGNLFRRRGEVERAIRIHQNLIARPTLDKEQRSQALLELGQDYLKAGLFDRAENLFLELAEYRLHNRQALHFLVQIYQQEKEWEQAISTCRKLARAAGKNLDDVIAQYYCEMAEQATAHGDTSAARNAIRQALSADRQCVRASILLGRLEAAQDRNSEALLAWKRIEDQDAHYLGEVVEEMVESFKALNDEDGLYEYLRATLQTHGGVSLMMALASLIEKRKGVDAAEEFVVEWLHREPSVHGLHHLIDLHLAQADASNKDDLTLLRSIIGALVEQQRGYVCRQCGFKGKSLHWQCPSCKRWNAMKPFFGGAID